MDKITFFGLAVFKEGASIDNSEIDALNNMQMPESFTDLRKFPRFH